MRNPSAEWLVALVFSQGLSKMRDLSCREPLNLKGWPRALEEGRARPAFDSQAHVMGALAGHLGFDFLPQINQRNKHMIPLYIKYKFNERNPRSEMSPFFSFAAFECGIPTKDPPVLLPVRRDFDMGVLMKDCKFRRQTVVRHPLSLASSCNPTWGRTWDKNAHTPIAVCPSGLLNGPSVGIWDNKSRRSGTYFDPFKCLQGVCWHAAQEEISDWNYTPCSVSGTAWCNFKHNKPRSAYIDWIYKHICITRVYLHKRIYA